MFRSGIEKILIKVYGFSQKNFNDSKNVNTGRISKVSMMYIYSNKCKTIVDKSKVFKTRKM